MTTDNDLSMDDAALAKLNELAGTGALKIITALPDPACEHEDNTRPSFYVLHDVESVAPRGENGLYRVTSVEYEAPEGSVNAGELVRDWTEGRPAALLKRLTEHSAE